LVKRDDLVAANWEKLDAWVNGSDDVESTQEPEAETEPGEGIEVPGTEEQTSEADATKEINAARAYISRNLPKLAGLEAEEKAKLASKVKMRVTVLLDFKAEISPETTAELIKQGLLDGDNGNA
jgi:hypothetical protein